MLKNLFDSTTVQTHAASVVLDRIIVTGELVLSFLRVFPMVLGDVRDNGRAFLSSTRHKYILRGVRVHWWVDKCSLRQHWHDRWPLKLLVRTVLRAIELGLLV